MDANKGRLRTFPRCGDELAPLPFRELMSRERQSELPVLWGRKHFGSQQA